MTYYPTGTVASVDRVDTSAMGNPTYRITFTDGRAYDTKVNAQVGYEATNYRPRGTTGPFVELTVTGGRVTSVRPVPPVFTSSDTGVIFDGVQGWHNTYRVIDLAVHHGLTLDARSTAFLELYRSGDTEDDSVTENMHDLSDEAVEFLNDRTDGTVFFTWHKGDFMLEAITDDES